MKPSVAEFLPPGKKGVAEVTHFEVSEEQSESTRIRAIFRPDEFVPAGVYAKLTVNGSLMMTDTQYEWHSNQDVVRHAHGSVLLGGLGIGMVLVPILQKSAVRSVLVVEKYQDVIDLVLPSLRARIPQASKLTVVCADIREWKPPKETKFDTQYFDIWANVCEDNLREMATLKRRFARCYNRGNPYAWRGCWEERTLRRTRQR